MASKVCITSSEYIAHMNELQQKKDLILAEKMAKKQASKEKRLHKLAIRTSKLKEQEQKNKMKVVQKGLKALKV